MRKRLCSLAGFFAISTGAMFVAPGAFAALTQAESDWLTGALPVLNYAKSQKLPIDIVVQPKASEGSAPLAMGFVDGRCKLVLSMRGNASSESALDGVAAALRAPVIETMVAHEVAHCQRYVEGAWHVLPAGFTDLPGDTGGMSAEVVDSLNEMRAARREEGFADLVGLAWTKRRHPELYERIHDWLTGLRGDQPVPGSHHDTRAWVRLARDAAVFDGGDSPFEQAKAVWRQGLSADD